MNIHEFLEFQNTFAGMTILNGTRVFLVYEDIDLSTLSSEIDGEKVEYVKVKRKAKQ